MWPSATTGGVLLYPSKLLLLLLLLLPAEPEKKRVRGGQGREGAREWSSFCFVEQHGLVSSSYLNPTLGQLTSKPSFTAHRSPTIQFFQFTLRRQRPPLPPPLRLPPPPSAYSARSKDAWAGPRASCACSAP